MHLPSGEVFGGRETFDFRLFSQLNPPEWQAIRDWAANHHEAENERRRIWVCPDQLPDQRLFTPLFKLAKYFDLLRNARGSQPSDNLIGNIVLYGKAVTSTQTQLTE